MKRITMKTVQKAALMVVCSIFLTSCFSYNSVVGQGAQGNKKVTKWNHYAIAGIAPISVSDSNEMADGATDYEIHTRRSFVNYLCSAATFGLYTPSITTVTK